VQESAEDPVRNQSINSLFTVKMPKMTKIVEIKVHIKESSREAPILTFPSKLKPINCSSHFFPAQEHTSTYQTRRGCILAAATLK